jgi:hypothetical protein
LAHGFALIWRLTACFSFDTLKGSDLADSLASDG